jgi:hypothetical protein
VGAQHQIAGSHQVALGDQLLDLEVEVWEGGQIVGDVLSSARGPTTSGRLAS